jgi:uncharacterized protein (DUF697 family)
MSKLTTIQHKRMIEIQKYHALWAGGLGTVTVFVPFADLAVIATVWTSLLIQIAETAGHAINNKYAKKFAVALVKGILLYVAGSNIGTRLLAWTGLGAPAAMALNAGLNYGYTWLLGGFLIKQFSQPNVDWNGLGKSAAAYLLSFGISEVSHIKEMHDAANVASDLHETMSIASDIHTGAVSDLHDATSSAMNFQDTRTWAGEIQQVMDVSISDAGDLHFAGYGLSADHAAELFSTPPLVQPDEFQNWISAITQSYNHPYIPFLADPTTSNAQIFVNSPLLGDEFIRYNPEFLASLRANYGHGAFVGSLAHEVGHSIMGTQPGWLDIATNWDNEQRADYFAGAVLAKFKLNIHEFLRSLFELGGAGTPTHPAGSTRVWFALKGYIDAGGKL